MSAPSVTISDKLPGIANRATASVTYVLDFSEPVTGLGLDDFLVLNCRVTGLAGSGARWEVQVRPNLDVPWSFMGIQLKAGGVTNASAQGNAVATNIEQRIDTLVLPPQLVTDASYRFDVNPQVTLQTRLGPVVIELNPQRAPVTVANMLAYVQNDFYDGTLFHRVIQGFMVQGGGLVSGMLPRAGAYDPIVLESGNGLSNLRGTIAMARTSAPNSATSQFFINQVDNLFLDFQSPASPGYAVFGHVVSGMPVIDALAQVSTGVVSGYADAPLSEQPIVSLNQTRAGIARTRTGVLEVSTSEAFTTWSYSLDGGRTWSEGSGTRMVLPEGSYPVGSIQVRQTDLAGNATVNPGSFHSTLVVDATAAQVVALSPARGAGRTDRGNAIDVLFSEPVERGSGSLVLRAADGTEVERFDVSQSSRVRIDGNRLTLQPAAVLGDEAGYVLQLPAGAVTDLAGNPLAAGTGHGFLTRGLDLTVRAYHWKSHVLMDGVAVTASGTTALSADDGQARLGDMPSGLLALEAARPVPAGERALTQAAVNLQDAIAILKLVVGLDIQPAGQALSPYQVLAADFDGNGRLELSDAIGVLKHVVGLTGPDSPSPTWCFVDESSKSVAALRSNPAQPGTLPPLEAVLGTAGTPAPVGLVAFLRGDVDGSFAGRPGALALEVEHPGYLRSLATSQGLDLSQFGIYS